MGADLILSKLELAPGAEPDWEAAEKHLADLTDAQCCFDYLEVEQGDFDPGDWNESPGQWRTRLEVALEGVISAYAGHRRDAVAIGLHGGGTLLVGGELSWGDLPDESFVNAAGRFAACGMAKAAGFLDCPDAIAKEEAERLLKEGLEGE